MTTAFVLSGGANLGAVQVGMLRALHEIGARPDVLVGTSVGAINAPGSPVRASTTGSTSSPASGPRCAATTCSRCVSDWAWPGSSANARAWSTPEPSEG